MEPYQLTPELQASWAKDKAGGIQSRELRWGRALQSFLQIAWPAQAAQKILEAAREPDQLEALVSFLAQEENQELESNTAIIDEWLDRVDDTGLPIVDWLEAYAVLHRFLQTQGRKTNFQLASGFMACSEEAAGMGYGYGKLADVVSQMLEEYGFEG